MPTKSGVLASSYTGGSGYASYNNMTNAYTNTSSTTYAQMGLKKNGTCYVYFNGFDFSDIPANAKIKSVTVKTKACVTNTGNKYVSQATLQAYTGSTSKGSATDFKSTTASVYTLSVGTWSRAELDDLRIRVYTKCGSSASSSTYTRVYGFEVTVEYEEVHEAMFFKQNGAWVQATKCFIKTNGAWVETAPTAIPQKNWVKGT